MHLLNLKIKIKNICNFILRDFKNYVTPNYITFISSSMTSDTNSSLCTKWCEYENDYLLPIIPWAPHVVSYTENYEPNETKKEDTLQDDWTTVVVKKRKNK